MSRPAAGPPQVPGVLTPTWVDQLRSLWWTEVGFIHGAFRWAWRERITSAVLAIGWWPALFATVPMKLVQARATNRREYMSPERDAVIAVVVDKVDLWVIADHVSRRPGQGQGSRLQDLIVGPLAQHADAAAITIEMTAANQRLAELYATRFGLEIVGKSARGRGILLRRRPQPPARGAGA